MSSSNPKDLGLSAFPRVGLGHYPTPLEAAPRLGRSLDINLLIKRDDCTGLAFGGNKVRQLEFYLGEAQRQAADTVLITGAVQSNFARLAAAACRRLGMDIHIQLEQRVPHDDPAYHASGNVLLDRLLGAHIHAFPAGHDEAAADAALEAMADGLAAAGRRPYVIHLGIDHPPLGGLGYVVAGQELATQLRAQNQGVDTVVVPSGSGLTHAGLLVGLRLSGLETPVTGICVRRSADLQQDRMLRRAGEIAALLGHPHLITEADILVSDVTLAPGYGQLNDTTLSAMSMAARLEGLMLDPVYSAKTLAGLVALVEIGEIASGRNVVFLHTGGQPALFGYASEVTDYLGRRPDAKTNAASNSRSAAEHDRLAP